MIPKRRPFAYVVKVSGRSVTLNLLDVHKGHQASHSGGISSVTEVGSVFAVEGGGHLLVLRTTGTEFAEPREAHRHSARQSDKPPLRYLLARVHGLLESRGSTSIYTPNALVSPALGAEAYPLLEAELTSILAPAPQAAAALNLGRDVHSGRELWVDLQPLLSRHMAVLGATGHGKSCFNAALLQQLLRHPAARVVVFDINSEYEAALRPSAGDRIKVTSLGGSEPTRKIPYYALGRHGLSRLFLPSERTQRPALRFALDSLPFVIWHPQQGGVALAGEPANAAVLFDDCRPQGARQALQAIDRLRARQVTPATSWPPMMAIGCLVAESHAIRQGRNGPERSSFEYSNVNALITRIQRWAEDDAFSSVVDIAGGRAGPLDLAAASTALVDDFFGTNDPDWKLHIVKRG